MSNIPPLPNPLQPDSKLIELEEKIMFQQQTHDQLSGVVVKQQTEIERLGRELRALRGLVSKMSERISDDELPPEKPPHY